MALVKSPALSEIWSVKILPAENVEAAHFDLNRIKMFIGDDEQIINEVLDLTKIELSESAQALNSHFLNKDLKGLNLTGHKLYGTAVSSGLMVLSKMANQIEHMERFVEEDISDMLLKANAEMDLVVTLIDKWKMNWKTE